ncbi:MAG TPA: zinc ribbon domain-containing protein [Candidatus Izemoplasmatales bacterium]|nr:zinc ribbon domain-containing protein [Bacillota bacterium]HRY77659.1 zinc ribbon domain-containing protein [Candidatus Izemoplasmatales bacterium]
MSAYPSGNPQKNPIRWFVVLFGLFWTAIAIFIVSTAMEVPGMVIWPAFLFPMFGVFFVIFALKSAFLKKNHGNPDVSQQSNEPAKNEDDPFAAFDAKTRQQDTSTIFCTGCGSHVDLNDTYCSKCGTRLR